MTYSEQLQIVLLDKGLLALVFAVAGFTFSWVLERRKARYELLKAVSQERATAYKSLWALLETVKASDHDPLSDAAKDKLYQELTNWYYEEGGGIWLSHQSNGRFLEARKTLRASCAPNIVRDRFSELRSYLKYDCGIYTKVELDSPVPVGTA